jgi:hypothetical protein
MFKFNLTEESISSNPKTYKYFMEERNKIFTKDLLDKLIELTGSDDNFIIDDSLSEFSDIDYVIESITILKFNKDINLKKIDIEIAKHVFNIIIADNYLEDLNLNNIDFILKNSAILSLENLSNLRTLSLSSNIPNISYNIRDCENLKHINFDDFKISLKTLWLVNLPSLEAINNINNVFVEQFFVLNVNINLVSDIGLFKWICIRDIKDDTLFQSMINDFLKTSKEKSKLLNSKGKKLFVINTDLDKINNFGNFLSAINDEKILISTSDNNSLELLYDKIINKNVNSYDDLLIDVKTLILIQSKIPDIIKVNDIQNFIKNNFELIKSLSEHDKYSLIKDLKNIVSYLDIDIDVVTI